MNNKQKSKSNKKSLLSTNKEYPQLKGKVSL